MKIPKLLLGVLFLLMVAALSQACSCFGEHPQTYYCNEDYVFQASILSKTKAVEDGHEYYIYQARVFKVFKAPENSMLMNETSRSATLRTPTSDSLCGIVLRNRVKYALTANLQGNHLVVNLCTLHMEWRSLTLQEKKGLHQKYRKNCGCNIKWCHGSNCRSTEVNNNTCMWNTLPRYNVCYEHHSICQLKDGVCDWMNPKDLRNCIADFLDDGSGGGEP